MFPYRKKLVNIEFQTGNNYETLLSLESEKQRLERMLEGVGIDSTFLKQLKNKTKELQDTERKRDNDLRDREKTIETHRDKIKTLDAELSEFDKHSQESSNLSKKISEIDKKLGALPNDKKKKRKALRLRREELYEKNKLFKEELDILEQKHGESIRAREALEEKISQSEKLLEDKMKEYKKSVLEAKREFEPLQKKLEELKGTEGEEIEVELNTLKEKLNTHEQDIKKIPRIKETGDFIRIVKLVEKEIAKQTKDNGKPLDAYQEGKCYSKVLVNEIEDKGQGSKDRAMIIIKRIEEYILRDKIEQLEKRLVSPLVHRLNEMDKKIASYTEAARAVNNSAHEFDVVTPNQEGILNFSYEVTTPDKQSSLPGMTNVDFATANSTPEFSGKSLETGQIIRASCKFSGKHGEGVGILEQNARGAIVDRSYGNLGVPQKALLAVEQAKMLLMNWCPGSGGIVIRGQDADQARRLHAAILLLKNHLKDDFPDLNTVNIKSHVLGVNDDLKSPKDVSNFIKKHLPPAELNALRNSSIFEETRKGIECKLKSFYAVIERFKPKLSQDVTEAQAQEEKQRPSRP